MKDKKKSISGMLVLVLSFAVIFGLALLLFMPKSEARSYKYSEIISLFQQNKVESYAMDFNGGKLTVTLRDGVEFETETQKPNIGNQNQQTAETQEKNVKLVYQAPDISLFLNDVHNLVTEYNQENPDDMITYDYTPQTSFPAWISFLPTIIITVVLIFFVFHMMNSGGAGKAMSFAKIKAKQVVSEKNKKTFNDVAGADEEKVELSEIVDFLKRPAMYRELGARIPKGVLLMGPPGTGKTLLAKAIAGEAGAPFFSISGSDFVEMFVGVGASRVRDLFEQAKKEAPSIIFIDEIDAVGRHRGAGLGGGHDEREQTLNQLLVEMDGFDENSGVIVIAATNRNDILDPALLRPGRFDRQIIVNYPDVKGREEILKVHARNKPIGADVELAVIAKTTAGFTGADLENLLNEAALLAARSRRKAIIQKDIEEATIKVMAGPEKKSKVITDKEKKITAYHEAGHAVTTYYLETQDPVHQVSIIPRGMAGGYTMHLPTEDRGYRMKKQMLEQIIVLLGGRVAEKLVLDDISTGASNDIERATKIAKDMIMRYGFSEKLGTVLYAQDNDEVFLGRSFNQSRNYSENVAAEIDSEIREILDTNFERAKDILNEHMDKLVSVAEYLLEFEKIDGDEFKQLMEGSLDIEQKRAELDKERELQKKKDELSKAIEEKQKELDDQNQTGEMDDLMKLGRQIDITVDDNDNNEEGSNKKQNTTDGDKA